jgi:hypothetical protein
MPSSIYKISEQVDEILSANPKAATNVSKGQIRESIGQAINAILRIQYYDTSQAGGETIPEGVVIACYDNVPVTAYKGVAIATLPAVPVSLPKGMGVYHVSRTDDINNWFIPIPRGQTAMLGDEPLISNVLDLVAYEVRSDSDSSPAILFKQDVTDASVVTPAITEIYIELLVYDISKYGDYDLLPITADMEAMVIEKVVKLLSTTPETNEIVDPVTDNKK